MKKFTLWLLTKLCYNFLVEKVLMNRLHIYVFRGISKTEWYPIQSWKSSLSLLDFISTTQNISYSYWCRKIIAKYRITLGDILYVVDIAGLKLASCSTMVTGYSLSLDTSSSINSQPWAFIPCLTRTWFVYLFSNYLSIAVSTILWQYYILILTI